MTTAFLRLNEAVEAIARGDRCPAPSCGASWLPTVTPGERRMSHRNRCEVVAAVDALDALDA